MIKWLADNLASAQKKSDFSITISDSDWHSTWPSLVSRQTVRLKFNLTARTLEFHIRQTAKGVIQDVLFHILSAETAKIDHILVKPGKAAGKYEYHFKDGIVVNHEGEFDYEDDGPMVHKVRVKFREVELKTPAKDTSVSTKITRDREILMEG